MATIVAALVITAMVAQAVSGTLAPAGKDANEPTVEISALPRPSVVADTFGADLRRMRLAEMGQAGDGAAGLWSLGRMYVPEGRERVELEDAQFVVSSAPSEMPALAGSPLTADWRGQVARYGEATAAFSAGYRAAGGPEGLLAHVLYDVLPCEWTGGIEVPWYPGNGYVSQAQFHPDSWQRAGGGDPYDVWTVGRNIANWINRIADPGSTSGWPVCWHRGGW